MKKDNKQKLCDRCCSEWQGETNRLLSEIQAEIEDGMILESARSELDVVSMQAHNCAKDEDIEIVESFKKK